MTEQPAPGLLTIGHSTRPIEVFLHLLEAHGVKHLVDVRTVPRSRYNPQFNDNALAASLRGAGIAYTNMKPLGGLRHPLPDSPNMGWRNLSFRGYADHMQTPEFAAAIDTLIEIADSDSTAIMCAEAVPWRCHRSLIADALTVRGCAVAHIMGEGPPQAHSLTSFAKVKGSRITYPPEGMLWDASGDA